ncbi:MAG: hypothetical protein A2508_01200 [Candidatus Lambdaproteobacteria bacterium RIFOXYD12_FULL_49_8]|uniref:Transporter n=1 Tax=Candidatus Lambdaproteobacteria bacterium RIFOXYD2_FULL_50_16 TaxID=1817772 RepID=A0A1F6G559_9PROT|nr:MAG: hypothetical protein A2527_13395 [Candidatus Lambdaproteobacteria bacterium RIFOXYD2_FULL_50_16]OGG97985.1 MAG: hypothetical protein A2508_01200 [Candidatus Lambdaproteobacteria bacterium RIFOXYD12_FULL_49_8]
MVVIAALGPVFFLIGIGMAVRRFELLPISSIAPLNSLLYWIFLPVLLFYKTFNLDFAQVSVAIPFLALLLGSLSCIAFSWLIGLGIGLPKIQRGAFMQAGFRGNLAFVGLPIALFWIGGSAKEAMIYPLLAPAIIFYNLMGVLLLVPGSQGVAWKLVLKNTGTNPLILSISAGLAYGYLVDWPLPLVFDRTFEVLSGAVLPLALVLVGAQASFKSIKLTSDPALWAGVIKTLVNPLFGLGWAVLLGLGGIERQILVILMISPTAAAAYILAEQLERGPELTARAIVFSVVFALLAYPLALISFGG